MPRSSSRIFVKSTSEKIHYMLWGDVNSKGDVMFGLPYKGSGQIEVVFDQDRRLLRPSDIVAPKVSEHTKATFHISGHYKLTHKMGKSEDSVDRATVVGKPLDQILEPTQMAILLLPKVLPSGEQPKDQFDPAKDVLLDLSGAPQQPMRCTICCVSKEQANRFFSEKITPNTIWQCATVLESATHAWVITFHVSSDDEIYPDRVIFGILGQPKWGRTVGQILHHIGVLLKARARLLST